MYKVTDNVYVESEISVCNTSVVVTKDGVVVIDTPMAPANAKKVAAEIAKFGPVRYVINSEPHTDHIAGNCYFGGTVVAHEGTREIMLAAKVEDVAGMLQWTAPDSLPLDKEFRIRPPEITFSERLTLYLGEHTFQLIHMPGHTPYSLAVYVPEEKIVFTSDNINLGMPVFRDSLPDKWLETLKRLEELDVDKVVPGHGEVAGKSCFSEMSALVKSWVDAVADAIAKGMSLEEAQEKLPLAEPFSKMPKEGPAAGFLRMNIERIYQVLKK